MLRAATKTSRFFNRDDASSTHGLMGHHSYAFWRLKTPEEHELETATKSKEARKYIFNCLEDMAQINVPNDLEGVELIAEKLDRRAFVSILKEMLQLDQERRIDPDAALKHTFVTMNHLVDYAHLKNVQMSFQMMEVCQKKVTRLPVNNSSNNNNNNHNNNNNINLNNNNNNNSNNVNQHSLQQHQHDVQNSAAAAALAAAASQNAALMSNFMPSSNAAAAAAAAAAMGFNGANTMPLQQVCFYYSFILRYLRCIVFMIPNLNERIHLILNVFQANLLA
jgi:homeodomain interacting protein kinase